MAPSSRRPTRSVFISVNHIAPSGPAVIPYGPHSGGSATEVAVPSVAIRPMRWSCRRLNQSAPSGPEVMTAGAQPGPRSKTLVPPGIRAIWPLWTRVTHTAPSGPAVALPAPARLCSTP